VVSLAPHLTEVVYAAGAGEQLVGAVSYSDYPEEARAIPRVGSYDSVSYETLLSLKPDLVLAWHEGNGEDVVTRLRSLGLNVYVSEPRALEDVAESLRVVGVLTGNEQAANAAASRFMQQLNALRETYSSREPVTVYYQIWNEPLLTLNGDHLISDVVRLCGGRNVFADAMPLVSRISVESVLRANPQVIIASGMDKARPEWLDDWREWSAMTAVKNDQLYFIPPDILQRHTPRIIEGATLMCEKLQQAREHYAIYAPQ
jgi:iron complex transport system substrate-binding protein